MVLHGKQEYCTSQNKGILYITEIRNIVHHRKQEYCTSLKSGILYIIEKKEFCTTQKSGILYNTENRNIVHHLYDDRNDLCSKGGSTLAHARTPPGSESILSLEA